MKAIAVEKFGGPEVLACREMPDPVLGAGELLVDVKAAGVNPVETYVRQGNYGPKTFPYTPGTDAAGVVRSVGAGVSTARVGDRVYLFGCQPGAYASVVTCSAARAHPLPDRLSFEQGAAVGVPYGTAYRALFVRGSVEPHETVFIHGGSGGVGTAAIQLAVARGCIVVATGGTPDGLNLVRQQGAALALNHHEPDYLDKLMAFTGGRGADCVIELLANVNLNKDLGVLAKRGRVVVVGSRGKVEIDPRQTMQKDADIRGMSLTHADLAELATIHAALVAGFVNGTLTPVVGQSFPLADAAKAHEAVMRDGAYGKVVLVP